MGNSWIIMFAINALLWIEIQFANFFIKSDLIMVFPLKWSIMF